MRLISAFGGGGAAAIMLTLAAAPASAQRLSDAAVKQRIIKASIAAYPGSCPCPYNTDRAGRSCGHRSAWNRPGGHAPKCYASDVTAAEVAAWRAGR